MEYRRLGGTGLKVSALALGSYATFGLKLGVGEARSMMEFAYEAGINFFDNAESYAMGASEQIMGEVLKACGWPRDSYCISSKAFWGGERPTQQGLSRKHLFDACDGSLRRLGLDYLDLFYCHRYDPEVSMPEIVRAMHDLVCLGKVRYWGTSEWPVAAIEAALSYAQSWGLHGPVMEQTQYNLLCRYQVEVAYHHLAQRGYALSVFSPLAGGLLSNKYQREIPKGSRLAQPEFGWLAQEQTSDPGKERHHRATLLAQVAARIGLTPAQLAIGWCLCQPNVSTILLGCSSLDQIRENLGVLELLPKFSPDLLDELDKLLGFSIGQRSLDRLKARIKALL